MIEKKDYYLYVDPCGRCWRLIPIVNPLIIMPFIVHPLSVEQFEALRDA